jgi:hypothetical protein
MSPVRILLPRPLILEFLHRHSLAVPILSDSRFQKRFQFQGLTPCHVRVSSPTTRVQGGSASCVVLIMISPVDHCDFEVHILDALRENGDATFHVN